MTHRIGWFDIPVNDLGRATQFYGCVLDIEFEDIGPDVPVSVMKHGPGDVAGCLFKADGHEPSAQGALLYFSVEGRINDAVNLVESAGGSVLETVRSIGPHGYRAVILDSEGNRIALHSETN